MKRIKLDEINKTVDTYRRQRNYKSTRFELSASEGLLLNKNEFSSVQEMALNELAFIEASICDQYLYSPCSINENDYLKQYCA